MAAVRNYEVGMTAVLQRRIEKVSVVRIGEMFKILKVSFVVCKQTTWQLQCRCGS